MELQEVTLLTPLDNFVVYKNGRRRVYVNCLCICGNKICVREDSFKTKTIKSCGCYKKYIYNKVKNQPFPINIKRIKNNIYYPIYGFIGYYISMNGKIYSEFTDRFIKRRKNKKNYVIVSIMESDKTKSEPVLLHRLLAKTFILNKDNKETVNHKDFNTLNYSLSNLEWATQQENNSHRNNANYSGERNNKSFKLKPEDVKEIYESTLPYEELESYYGVKKQMLYKIKNGKCWYEVTKDLKKGNSDKNYLDDETIKRIYKEEGKIKDIAKKYKVSRETVSKIKQRKIHSNVTKDLVKGESTHNHFTKELVKSIYLCEGTQKYIANKFNISQSAVSNIKSGKTYSNITKYIKK